MKIEQISQSQHYGGITETNRPLHALNYRTEPMYKYSKEELDRRLERAYQKELTGTLVPFEGKLKEYLEWVVKNGEDGVSLNKETPKEFQCFIK